PLLLLYRVADVPDHTFTRRQPTTHHPFVGPPLLGAGERREDPPPTRPLAGLGTLADEDGVLVGVVAVALHAGRSRGAGDVADGQEELHEQGHGVRLARRLHGPDEPASESVVRPPPHRG